MSARVLLNLLNEFGKSDKMRGCKAFYIFCNELNNSIIPDHES